MGYLKRVVRDRSVICIQALLSQPINATPFHLSDETD